MAPDVVRRPVPRARSRARRIVTLAAIVGAIAVLVAIGTRRPSAHPGPSASSSAGSGAGSPFASVVPSDATSLPSAGGSIPSGSPGRSGDVVGFVSLETLRARAANAAAGVAPDEAAVRNLAAWAATAVDHQANPKERLNIGGTTGSFVDDTAFAYGLALAWATSGDPAYATASRDIVMAWVDTTTSLKNACPDGGDCQTALIVSRNAPGFIFAVELLEHSDALTPDDLAAFDAWLRNLILPAASIRSNNWGDAGAFLRATATAHLGDTPGWDAALAFWRKQLDLVAADGSIPEEVRRGTSGLSYTQEALMYKVAVARIAERRGVDLWSAVGANGASLRDALVFASNALHDPGSWPAGPVDRPEAAPVWELVQEHWPDPSFADLIREGRPFGFDGHSAVRWTTLTDGVAIQP